MKKVKRNTNRIIETISEPLPEWAKREQAKRQLVDVLLIKMRIFEEAVEQVEQGCMPASESAYIMRRALNKRVKPHGNGTG